MNLTKHKSWYKIKSLIPKQAYEPLLNLYLNVSSLGYSGTEFHCPICKSDLKKFRSVSCPKCGSGVRHRMIWLFLERKTNFFKDDLSVLHFAPEHCFYKHFRKQKNLNYLSADIGSPRAMVEIDMTNIQYPDNSFDVVLSSHVLEHVNDDIKAMKELCRVQKKAGWSVHLAPIDYSRKDTFEDPSVIDPDERQRIFGHHDHKRIYGTDYKNRLESAGFTVSIFKTSDFCNEKEIIKMGLKPNTEIYLCKK
jgi:SAM-dependent methyltransferase